MSESSIEFKNVEPQNGCLLYGVAGLMLILGWALAQNEVSGALAWMLGVVFIVLAVRRSIVQSRRKSCLTFDESSLTVHWPHKETVLRLRNVTGLGLMHSIQDHSSILELLIWQQGDAVAGTPLTVLRGMFSTMKAECVTE
ncbi:MAG: hypothetical protein ACI8W8_000964 [Rhodothermales bacterium]|jgi:hypothetical protein